MKKGLLLLALHCGLLLSVAGKCAFDRESLPRQWMRTRPYDPDHWLRGRYIRFTVDVCETANCVVRPGPLAFYIPEHIPDPSRRQPGEELWVEVSIPGKGPLRPVRLGVKKDGLLTPLELR